MRVSKSTQISVPCTFALIWFGPSPMSTGTTTEASFLTFVATQWASTALAACQALWVTAMWLSGSPWSRIRAFTSSIRPFYIAQIRLVMGLHVILHTYPLRMPKRVPVTAFSLSRTEDLLFPSLWARQAVAFSLSSTRSEPLAGYETHLGRSSTLATSCSCSGLSPYSKYS